MCWSPAAAAPPASPWRVRSGAPGTGSSPSVRTGHASRQAAATGGRRRHPARVRPRGPRRCHAAPGRPWRDTAGRMDAVIHLVGGWRGAKGIADQSDDDWDFLERGAITTLRNVSRVFYDDLAASGTGRFAMVSSTAVDKSDGGDGQLRGRQSRRRNLDHGHGGRLQPHRGRHKAQARRRECRRRPRGQGPGGRGPAQGASGTDVSRAPPTSKTLPPPSLACSAGRRPS